VYFDAVPLRRRTMIYGDNDEEYGGPDNREMTEYDDLSEIELQEMEEELVRDLREEGLLRPRLVKSGDYVTEADLPENLPSDSLDTF
jgi:hypothetical protein